MTTDNPSLRECPCCASEQITTAPYREFGDVTWDVICKACGLRVARDLEADAIAAWNRRASPLPQQGLVELIERARKLVNPVVMVGDFDDDEDEMDPTYPPPSKWNANEAVDILAAELERLYAERGGE